ncbi:hypothetical protein D3C75_1271080 [compost metagenome]
MYPILRISGKIIHKLWIFIVGRRTALVFFELAEEVIHARVSDQLSHFIDFHSLGQQLFGFLDPDFVQVGIKVLSGLAPEQLPQIRCAVVQQARQCR